MLASPSRFQNATTAVQQYMFLPKFHCEINPIEGVWGQSKRYCRAYTNFTLVKLRQTLNGLFHFIGIPPPIEEYIGNLDP